MLLGLKFNIWAVVNTEKKHWLLTVAVIRVWFQIIQGFPFWNPTCSMKRGPFLSSRKKKKNQPYRRGPQQTWPSRHSGGINKRQEFTFSLLLLKIICSYLVVRNHCFIVSLFAQLLGNLTPRLMRKRERPSLLPHNFLFFPLPPLFNCLTFIPLSFFLLWLVSDPFEKWK